VKQQKLPPVYESSIGGQNRAKKRPRLKLPLRFLLLNEELPMIPHSWLFRPPMPRPLPRQFLANSASVTSAHGPNRRLSGDAFIMLFSSVDSSFQLQRHDPALKPLYFRNHQPSVIRGVRNGSRSLKHTENIYRKLA
jgi:hypothetical protein